MSTVSFRGVVKRFGDVVALDNLTLDVEAGEFVSLLGPSGSGKSTTLNVLAGLLETDEGQIFIGDKDVTDLSPDRRDLALVFQNYALYPHMTVFENIAFPLRAKSRKSKTTETEIETRVEAVAQMLGIHELLARYPRELSGGQQQRVALGRAMVREPQVFLLDEPLSNLDARLRIRMRRDLKDLHQRLRSTIVYVTHDQAEAMSMSSRIAVFNKGKLQQFAPPEEIYNRPANLFVANFVGERELVVMDAAARTDDRGVLLECGDMQVLLPDCQMPVSTETDRRVQVGLRAEAIRKAEANEPGAFSAEITQTELSGPDLIIYARTKMGTEVYCRTEPYASVELGSEISLAVVPRHVLTFDPESGDAIHFPAKGVTP